MGAEDWHDPHDLIPEQFRERFADSETVAAALRRAESLPSSTPDSERRCCPDCFSVSITPKSNSSMTESTNRLEGSWKCTECEHHFDKPLDMNPKATAFEWIDSDELPDTDARERLTPSLDVDRETAVRYALLLRAPWRDDEPLSYTEIAAALPYEDSWVGNRVREWRDGEHRDLVPDPTADPEPAPSSDPPIDPRAAVARIGGGYEELVAERAATADASSGATAVATDGGRVRRWDAYGSG